MLESMYYTDKGQGWPENCNNVDFPLHGFHASVTLGTMIALDCIHMTAVRKGPIFSWLAKDIQN